MKYNKFTPRWPDCTEENCKRWGYQCESSSPGCFASQPFTQEHVYIKPSKEEYELGEDKVRIERLEKRGYKVIRKTDDTCSASKTLPDCCY